MKIRVDTITSSPSALHLGCVVEGPKGAWVRFATVEIPFAAIPLETVNDVLLYGRPDKPVEDLDLPLF
jgi:hypothetical protein